MEEPPTSERAVFSEPGLVTHSLFRKGKAFLSETKANQSIIFAHRFLPDAAGATTVDTSGVSIEDEIAQKEAVDFQTAEENKNFSRQTIRNEAQLRDFLQNRWSDYKPPRSAMKSSHVLFINRTRSSDTLNVTRTLMHIVLDSVDAFNHLKDFIILYDRGPEGGELELYPPPCVFREFGSEKHGFECVYAFSHVDKEETPKSAEVSLDSYWPVRRTVIYHRYSFVEARRREIWIVIGSRGGSEDLRKQILAYQAHSVGGTANPSPFELHLLIQHCHMGNWRPRLRWMADEIWSQVNLAITMPIDTANLSRRERLVRKTIADKSQARQNIWEKVDDSILAVEALIEMVVLLKENFLRFEGEPEKKALNQEQEMIVRGFDMKKRQAEAVLKQLKALRGKAESTSSLYARLTVLQSKSLADQSTRNSRITTTLAMLTASFLPTAVLGTFFSGTRIFERRNGYATYWGIIFGTAIGLALLVWVLGLIYGWWVVEDVVDGLRPIGECFSSMKNCLQKKVVGLWKKIAGPMGRGGQPVEAKKPNANETMTTEAKTADVVTVGESSPSPTGPVNKNDDTISKRRWPGWMFSQLRGRVRAPTTQGDIEKNNQIAAGQPEKDTAERHTSEQS